MVGPTKRKPRCLSALLIASDTGVVAGMSSSRRQALTTGAPPLNAHRNSENRMPDSRTSNHARALPIAACTLRRLRTMPGSSRSDATFLSS